MLDFDRHDVEDIILCMADIVVENRNLKYELQKAKVYEKKYFQLINENVKASEESNKELLKAIFAGAFAYSKAEETVNNM